MAKGYIIARVTVEDDESYMRYAHAAAVAMKKYGAHVLARGGRYEPLDGEARPRNVILEFESYDQAKAYYDSLIASGKWRPGTYPPPPHRYPEGIETPRTLPNLTKRMVERGFSAEDTKKVLGENWLRVYEAVWGA